MNPVVRELQTELARAYQAAGFASAAPTGAVRPCGDPQFGDYQNNEALGLAKTLQRKPRDVAEAVAAAWKGASLASVSIAGPGFINLRFTDDALVRAIQPRLGGHFAEKVRDPLTLLLDFSSPNVAKSMHVGHIRSTVLGDCLARVMRFLGHRVITDNHLGDWGTQFGILITAYRKLGDPGGLEADPIAEMERLYKLGNDDCKANPAALDAARDEVRKLQDGQPGNVALWEKFRALSQSAFEAIYRRLNVRFDHTLGESFYNPMLKETVDDLVRKGIARESEGAICVFFDGDPQLADKPFLIQKSDGAALYGTTDLATLRYRMDHFQAGAVWYVTDMRQSLHFQQLFATARKWGVTADLRHIGFGAILGADKRPLKTREGAPVKLEALLDEAVARALAIVRERRADLAFEEKEAIAEVLGIGSVKYADLAQNRHLDYVFDWNKLLAFDGNTAPYVLNAYVRIRSIFRKSCDPADAAYRLGVPGHPRERDLLLHLAQWEDTVQQVADEQRPHYLCFYLFHLSGLFHSFFEECPVLKADPKVREHRLALCQATAATLHKGCELLGIPSLERM